MTLLDHIPPVHPDGRNFIAIAAVVTLVCFLMDWTLLGWIGVGLTLWVAAFFRDPPRFTPAAPGLLVAPADGVVSAIASVAPPPELGLGAATLTRVSIFLSIFDVHINRAPVGGRVARIIYRPGAFVSAELDKASDENERQMFVVETPEGVRVGFVQIAGLIARRIVRFVKEEDNVLAGQRIGLIRFGSRVDLYLPEGAGPAVTVGQRMVGGETIVARLGSAEAAVSIRQ